MSEDLLAGVALRWLRAGVLASVALGFAGVAHVSAGGGLPGPVAMTVLTVLVTALLASVLGRPASTRRVVVLVAGGQALLHGVFTAAGGHGGAAHHETAAAVVRVAVPRGGIADALGAGQLTSPVSTAPSPLVIWVHHLVEDLSTATNLAMAVAHLAAAALIGWWLAAGERLVWRLLADCAGSGAAAVSGLSGRRIASLLALRRGVRAWAVPSVAVVWFDRPAPRLRLIDHCVARRGPPAVAI